MDTPSVARRSAAVYIEMGLVAVLTVLAFVVRLKALGKEGLWFDEADLVIRARADLGTLFANFVRPGENGPLYTLLLHFVYGDSSRPMPSESVVRLPSMLCSVASIPLIWLLGRRLWPGMVGLGAAVLLTISPYHIWYAQDAKMYSLITLLVLASTYALVAALQTHHRVWWVAFALLTLVSFYIHLIAPFVLLAQLLYLLLMRRGQRIPRRLLLVGAGIGALIMLFGGVWIVRGLIDGNFGKGWYDRIGPLDMLGVLAVRFAVNRSLPQIEIGGATLYALLAAAGLYAAWQQRSPKNRVDPFALLGLWLAAPLVSFFLFQLYIPLFADRYLMVVAPAYYLLASGGLVWLARRAVTLPLAALALAAILALTALAMNGLRYSATPQKEDWRGAVDYLQKHARPYDRIFIFPGYLRSAFDYYWHPTNELKQGVTVISALSPQDAVAKNDLGGALTNRMDTLLGTDAERVWLLTSPDRYTREEPTHYLTNAYFRYNAYQFDDPFVSNGVAVTGYETIRGLRPYTAYTDLTFGDALKLDGFDYSVPGDGTYRQGDFLRLTFYWFALSEAAGSRDYAIRVRLLHPDGSPVLADGKPYQDPAVPVLRGYLVDDAGKPRWPPPTQQVRDYRDIYMRPDLPPGQYRIELSVYNEPTLHADYPDGNPALALMPHLVSPPADPKGAATLAENGTAVVFSLPFTVTP